jgi:hypothetical protein
MGRVTFVRVTHFSPQEVVVASSRPLPARKRPRLLTASSGPVVLDPGLGRWWRAWDRVRTIIDSAADRFFRVGEKLVDGPIWSRVPDNRYWVVPFRTEILGLWFLRMMSGRGQFQWALEFDAYPSELRPVGGVKWMFGLGFFQRYIEEEVILAERHPTSRFVGRNWLEYFFFCLVFLALVAICLQWLPTHG